MDEELTRTYRRWRHAEANASEDEADATFASLFDASVSSPLPSRDLTSKTLAAIAAASAQDARRARRLRTGLAWAGGLSAVVFLYFGSGLLLSGLSGALVGGLNLLVATIVWFAEGGSTRAGVWSALSGLGRATAALVAEPKVTVGIIGFQAVAAAALIALHRLLGNDREWLK
jgi:hypothetical protein